MAKKNRLWATCNKLKDGYSKVTVVAALVLLASLVPDWQARIAFWLKIVRWAIPRLASPWGRTALVVCGLAVIFLDHRRMMQKRVPQPPDMATLRGRALKLRDEMQTFLESAPPAEPISSTISEDEIMQSTGSALRVSKLHHGYAWRFAEQVNRIFHEFGERNVLDMRLATALNADRQVYNEALYRLIVESLSDLAERPEANG